MSTYPNTLEVYERVIEDVIQKVEVLFEMDGVEREVLEDLKNLWRAKLSGYVTSKHLNQSLAPPNQMSQLLPFQLILLKNPILITSVNLQAPCSSLNSFFSANVSSAVKDAEQVDLPLDLSMAKKTDPSSSNSQLPQVDGTNDNNDTSSSEEDEDYDTDSMTEINNNENLDNVLGGQVQNTPLNSDDDLSEENDDFDTENIIVCQYDKITRRLNKWKIYLKAGVMMVDGKEQVFKCCIGDADW